MTNSSRTPIPGSEREPLEGVRPAGAVDPDRIASVTLTLKRRGPDPDPDERVDHDEFARRFGADPEEIKSVEDFAAQHGLDVVEADAARRTVVVRGRLADLGSAFDTDLQLYEHPDLGLFRGRVGTVSVPSHVADSVESVLGLDDRPAAFPRMLLAAPEAAAAEVGAPPANFSGADLAKIYGFPAGTTGKGQTIAIIELGGGYKPADLAAYFARASAPAPSVDGGARSAARTNAPVGNPNSADGEVLLDIDVIGAIAPRRADRRLLRPNTDRGLPRRDHPGGPRQDAQAVGDLDQLGHGRGCPAAGPRRPATPTTRRSRTPARSASRSPWRPGTTARADGVNDGKAHVDFPAASPFVLACGGTQAEVQGRDDRQRGGLERAHRRRDGRRREPILRPAQLPDGPRRARPSTTPRSRAAACRTSPGTPTRNTGYHVRVDGQNLVFGGTSAVAPLWAALIARVNEKLGTHAGFANPALVQVRHAARHHVGQQRRLQRQRGLRRLHRAREPGRREGRGRALVVP